MVRPIMWLLDRMAMLVLGVIVLTEAIHYDTNFGPVAGLICGAVVFVFVLFVVMKKSVRNEQIFLLTSPCWPPWKYPQTYWFTTGSILFLSAFLNMITHLSNPSAISLFFGLSLFGLGMFAGAVVAHYQVRRRNL